jgi:hypothetical protein
MDPHVQRYIYGNSESDSDIGKHVLRNSTIENKKFETTWFAKSFRNIKNAKKCQSFVNEKVRSHSLNQSIVLPPLLIRSQENIIVRLPFVTLICCQEGPIVPILSSDAVDDMQALVIIRALYSLKKTRISVSNIRDSLIANIKRAL